MAEAFRPFDIEGIPLDIQPRNWSELVQKPYDKRNVDAHTRTRAILMNGIENNATLMAHSIARTVDDDEVKKTVAHLRRLDSMQQQFISWMTPADQTVIETTIGYEQVAVDLTANLAQNEPDPYFKQVLDFGLLEDFDHLFRYGCLMEAVEGNDPNEITQGKTEIKPGRATMDEHRHPADEMRKHYDKDTADIKTKMNYHTIVSAEQQAMLFYKAHGFQYENDIARRLYSEIADVEQQHVTQYELVGDPRETPLEKMAMMELCEAYNYYSCAQTETDPRMKAIWEQLCAEEIEHFNVCSALMKKKESRDIKEIMQKDSIDQLIVVEENKQYVNDVLENTVDWRPVDREFVPLDEVPASWASWEWNKTVNRGGVPSEDVVEMARRAGKLHEVSPQLVGAGSR